MRDPDDVWRRRSTTQMDARPSCRAFYYVVTATPSFISAQPPWPAATYSQQYPRGGRLYGSCFRVGKRKFTPFDSCFRVGIALRFVLSSRNRSAQFVLSSRNYRPEDKHARIRKGSGELPGQTAGQGTLRPLRPDPRSSVQDPAAADGRG